MNVPDNVINKKLYKQVKLEADNKFKRPTSAYKSMWIVKTYKNRGGKYKGKKEGLTKRWREEEWIQVKPFIEDNKKIACGSDNRKNKVCRPLIRVDEETPITIKELQKIYTDDEILKLANMKIKDMKGRVMWKQNKFIKGGNLSKFDKVKELVKKFGGEDVRISKRKHKKYDVYYNGKWISFGDNRYEDFLDHQDPKRRDNYRNRASKIKNKYNEYTNKDPNYPNYWAFNVLW